MIDQQAVVKLGTSSRVERSVPEGQSGGAFHRGVGCPQLLHGRTPNQPRFLSRQPLTVTFTLDQYNAQLRMKSSNYNGWTMCAQGTSGAASTVFAIDAEGQA